ncbi:thermonuclease family protein [Paracoccus fontiphilus]
MRLPTPRAAIEGPARVIDGDTLVIGGWHTRILGIDAPELDQTCHASTGQTWACGRDARQALAARVGRRQVSCRVAGQDRYGRALARCATGGTDLAGWLVREGWAIPAGNEQKRYRAASQKARANGAGMWRGSFIRPADWRRAGDPQRKKGAVHER